MKIHDNSFIQMKKTNSFDLLIDTFSIPEIQNALFICNHSGGKDSQAMYKILSENPMIRNLIIVHAELPGADWESTIPHIQNTTNENFPLHVVRAKKSFEEMVINRGMFPSPKYRQCTSDLKSAPIQKFTRQYAKEHGFNLVFNCMGLRAEESPKRKKKPIIKNNKKISNNSRQGFDFLPIHDYSIDEVLGTYGESYKSLTERRRLYTIGERELAFKNWPFSEIYVKGLTRHSCKLCIMASRSDLLKSAALDPEHFQRFINIENQTGHSFAFQNGHKVSLQAIAQLGDQQDLFKSAS